MCEKCSQHEATVHLTQIGGANQPGDVGLSEHHFCERCADGYMQSNTTLRGLRNLICLSDDYRTRLYDLLELTHPEVFYDGQDEARSVAAADAMVAFLRQQFAKERLEVSNHVFEMLVSDFAGSEHFYSRREAVNRQQR